MSSLYLVLSVSLLLQAEPRDRMVLQDRTVIEGKYRGTGGDGSILWTGSGGERRIDSESVSRVYFHERKSLEPGESLSRVSLVHGSILSGRVIRFASGRLEFQTSFARLMIDRQYIESISFPSVSGEFPQEKESEQKKDRLFKRVSGKTILWSGRIESISPEKVEMTVDGVREESGRKGLKEIRFVSPAKPDGPLSGWYAKIRFRNGDRAVGMLFRSGKERLRIFSHILGSLAIPLEDVYSIQFSREARITWGRILVCDRTGVQEMDRAGKVTWSYQKNVQFAWGAVRLESGNILIAATNFHQILEINREKEIVWRLSGVSYPYDVERLPNGNTLVAEYMGGKVSEFSPQGKRVWTYSGVKKPTSIQRLDSGNTLIGSISGVIEVDPGGKLVWTAPLNRVRATRARQLENGNILICDQMRGQVVEIDRAGKTIWKMSGVGRPVAALRMENGRTLILEQASNRIIEVDSSARIVHQIDGFNYPQAISIY